MTKDLEWIKAKDGHVQVGITKYALGQLGEIVYIELPEVGRRVEEGEEVVILESTKAATDIYAPKGGKITRINEKLRDNPSLINHSPEDEGWLYELSLD